MVGADRYQFEAFDLNQMDQMESSSEGCPSCNSESSFTSMSIEQSDNETPNTPKPERQHTLQKQQTSVRASDLLAFDEQSRKKAIAKNSHKIFFEDKKLLKTMSSNALKRHSMKNLNLISMNSPDAKKFPPPPNNFRRQTTQVRIENQFAESPPPLPVSSKR